MELADWDLHAVVRSCYTSTSTSTSTAAATTTTSIHSSPISTDPAADFINRNPSTTDLQYTTHHHRNQLALPPPFSHPPPHGGGFGYGSRSSFSSFTRGELQDLCNPFISSNLHFPSLIIPPLPSPTTTTASPSPPILTSPPPLPSFYPLVSGLISEPVKPLRQQQQQQQMAFQQYPSEQQQPPKRARFVFGTTTSTTTTTPPSVTATVAGSIVSSPDSTAFSISNITPPSLNQRHSNSLFCSPAARTGSTTTTSTTQTQQKTKKRKNIQKKVFHVSAEGLSSDMWAWRKYGQKPIKGSPYPRGYYRCSSSKGCLARKQVERNRSDPKMFIVTYTAEHNHPMPTHRNSLAGSTRQKPTTSADGVAPGSSSTGLDQSAGCCSSPTARLSLSPNNTNMAAEETLAAVEMKRETFEDEDDDEEDLLMKDNNGEDEVFPETVLGGEDDDDDFFAGFRDLDDNALLFHGGDGFDRFRRGGSVEMELPWLVNGGGGVGGGCSGQPLVADGS